MKLLTALLIIIVLILLIWLCKIIRNYKEVLMFFDKKEVLYITIALLALLCGILILAFLNR